MDDILEPIIKSFLAQMDSAMKVSETLISAFPPSNKLPPRKVAPPPRGSKNK